MIRNPEECTRLIEQGEVRQVIHFELGQASAQIYLDVRSKDRNKRWAALDRLADKVAVRFEELAVYGPPPIDSGSVPWGGMAGTHVFGVLRQLVDPEDLRAHDAARIERARLSESEDQTMDDITKLSDADLIAANLKFFNDLALIKLTDGDIEDGGGIRITALDVEG